MPTELLDAPPSGRAKLVLAVEGLLSPGTERAVETTLAKLPGVSAKASFDSQTVQVEFDRSRCAIPEIVRRLDALGLRLRGDGTRSPLSKPAAPKRIATAPDVLRWLLHDRQIAMALLGGALLIGALLVNVYHGPQALRLALIIPAYLLTGWHTFKDTARTLWEIRFDIDVLMFAAAFGAASLGHYEEGGLLLFLFSLGGAGETMAMDRARRAIQALARLAPETAHLREADGSERLVRVADLKVGDEILVRPFDRVPADGKVVTGVSAIDQSPITGESIPAEKVVGSPVFAATINGEGLLIVGVTKLASESTLAKIVKMVEAAQASKSPTQLFTDKVERIYVPLVLVATALLIFLPPLLMHGPHAAWSRWFYRSMAFLTAASPCALAIGTPAAVLSGIARAARGGVLMKGGVHLENLGRVRAIAFDKTGTLTRGRPKLTDILPLDGMTEPDILSLAAAVEANSSHPLAQAVVAEAQARQCADRAVENVQQIPAQGVRARIDGQSVSVGKLSMSPSNAPLMTEAKAAIERFAAEGKTTMVLSIEGHPRAVLALADSPRPNAKEMLARLRRLGVDHTIMLTGDHGPVAAAVARELGVDEFFADLLPQDKVDRIKQLCDQYRYVAMVGDGVNDAPAMANATVGIAMGGAGTDVALETADIALMGDDLGKLPEAIGLSRFSRRIIKQNLTLALGVICILAPVAALGGTSLGLAVLFHEGSTVIVVLNSLRILMYQEKIQDSKAIQAGVEREA